MSCVLAIVVIFVKLGKIKTNGKVGIFSWQLLGRFAIIAVPSILQQSFISVGNIVIQSVINSFGAVVMAGYSAAIKLNNMIITSLTTLGNGISNFTAQNLGAAQYDRIKAGFRAGLKLVWALCLPLVLLYEFAGKWLVYVFLESPTGAATDTGVLFLRIVSPFYFVVAAKLVADGILRGAGLMKKFMIATFTDLFLRVALAEILARTALGTTGIWISWPIGWTVAAIVSILFYATIKWDKFHETPQKIQNAQELEDLEIEE